MQAFTRGFACDKCIVLGALYDTLDRLRWELVSANSDEGILMAAPPGTGLLFLVRVQPGQAGGSEVSVAPASGVPRGSDLSGKAAETLLETLRQIINGALTGGQEPDAHRQ
jgi:hypothetical protein